MPVFSGRMGGPDGEILAFTQEAANEELLRSHIQARGYYAIEVEAVKTSWTQRFSRGSKAPYNRFQLIGLTRDLRRLLKAGMPLLESLELMIQQQLDPQRRRVLKTIAMDLCRGLSLSEAMGRFRSVFPPDYVKSIMAGEQSGSLESVLERQAVTLLRREELARKVFMAAFYPMILLGISGVICLWLIVDVLPEFQAFFASSGVPLPFITRALLGGSSWIWRNLLLIVILAFFAFYQIRQYARSEKGKRFFDGLVYRLPLIGQVTTNAEVSNLGQILATLLHAGIPLVEALRIAGQTLSNSTARERLDNTVRYIEHGNSISQAFESANLFPTAAARILRIGEESASLESVLSDLADFYDEETRRTVDVVTNLLPILFVIVLGIMILIILLAIFLPIWEGLGAADMSGVGG